MAIKTASVSGAWSNIATWGGVLPVNGDSVVIPQAISVLMDVDTSGMAAGIAGVTINGSSGTPGMLYWKAGTSGILKTSANIVGTTGTNKGRILANGDGIWGNTAILPFVDKATVQMTGTAQITGDYLDMRLYCADPVLKMVGVYGALKTISSVDAGTDTFTSTSHGLANSTAVMIRSTGELPAPLKADTEYFIRDSATSTFTLASVSSGSTIDITSAGSGVIEIYTGAASGLSVLPVLSDLTGDAAWSTTTGHNSVVLCNSGPQDYDQQRLTISSKSAGTITVSAPTDSAQRPGAKLVMASRNIAILSSSTGSTQQIVATLSGGVLGCEIRNTAGTGTVFYNYGLNNCSNCEISGIISGCNTSIIYCSNCDVSGVISGCANGLNTCSNCEISGVIGGCNFGLNSCSNCEISGVIGGCASSLSFTRYLSVTVRDIASSIGAISGRNGSSNIARVSYENYLGVVGAHKVVDNFGAITKTLVGSGAPTPDSGPGGIYGSCLAVDDLQSTLGQFLGLDVIRSMRVHASPGSRIVRFKTVNNFTGGIPIGKLKLNLKYRDATGKQVSTEFTNAETLTAATDWSQTITGTVVTTGEWVTVTLSLWHYEALKSLFVWPEVYML